jgi:hypothetical protein
VTVSVILPAGGGKGDREKITAEDADYLVLK